MTGTNFKLSHVLIAALVIAVSSMGYVHSFIYPRTEGEALVRRVDRVEDSVKDEMKEIKSELKELNKWLREHLPKVR